MQSATCDFVVWCLVAVLDKVTSDSSRYEEFAGSSTGWIDHICVPSALGQHERAIKFFKNYHSGLISFLAVLFFTLWITTEISCIEMN